jgi:hypothetical protein
MAAHRYTQEPSNYESAGNESFRHFKTEKQTIFDKKTMLLNIPQESKEYISEQDAISDRKLNN